ncbi:MAG: molybdenum cofactor guanylyltransferase [Candidatus Brockarchaeota archaeon]|nr:molybdenum cofactor guanylyltransferase [Candidatus Brockarchaeota archaeon]
MRLRNRSAIVLAGGSGKRLQGVEKCLLEVSGVPMIELVLAAAKEVCDEIVVSVSGPAQMAVITPFLGGAASVVCDSLEGVGPLEGIRQACRALGNGFTAVVACDMPLLNPRVIEYLFNRMGRRDGAVPMWPDGKLEPLCSVFKKRSLENSVEKAVLSGKRKITDAFAGLDIVYVETKELEVLDPGLRTFANVNDQSSLEKVRRIAAGRQSAGMRGIPPRI